MVHERTRDRLSLAKVMKTDSKHYPLFPILIPFFILPWFSILSACTLYARRNKLTADGAWPSSKRQRDNACRYKIKEPNDPNLGTL